MMGFRVTSKTIGQRSLDNLQLNMGKLARLQEKLSSGKEVSRPSDDPSAVASSMRLRGETQILGQYGRNAGDGLGWLSTLDNTLTSSLDLARRARDLTLQGMSDGAGAATGAREAIAAEIDALREGMLNLANTRYLDRPVFGGTTTGMSAYSPTGTFVGDTNPVTRTIGDGVDIRVEANGPEVFGSGATDMFAILGDIATRLRTSPGALGGDLGRLDDAMGVVTHRLAEAGAAYNRIDRGRQIIEDRMVTLNGELSEVEDIDLPKTIVALQMQDVAYQAALGATAKIVRPSLLDFLR